MYYLPGLNHPAGAAAPTINPTSPSCPGPVTLPLTSSGAPFMLNFSGGRSTFYLCTSDVGQGPLAGCLSGQGVRWDTVELRASTSFKCTGAATEPLKTASTDEDTVVLLADFYRAGDGVDESFTAQMIVSADDIAPDIAGTQNAWIQGVGCASAIANFSS